MRPSVSAIIPVFNGAKFLRRALQSVTGQTYADLEIIVVDDGSTDGAVSALPARARLTVVNQARRGPGAARNAGVRASSGDVLAFLDADDRWLPDKVAAYVDFMSDNAAQAAIGRFRYELEPGCAAPRAFNPKLFAGHHVGPIPSALVLRRTAFERIGGFDETLPNAEDVDWFARAASAGLDVPVAPGVHLIKSVHDANLSLCGPATNEALFRALRASIQRRNTKTEG